MTKSNGVVPMQVNEEELKAILDNAKDYLPFLIRAMKTVFPYTIKLSKYLSIAFRIMSGRLILIPKKAGLKEKTA